MKFDFDSCTFGCELELGDVDTRNWLPPGNKWDYKDGSICNSNGTANDPKKKLNRYGGEIQVKPASSPVELLHEVLEIYRLFYKMDFNFTTNLHVHIRLPGLIENLEALKLIAAYLNSYGKRMFELIDPIPLPDGKGIELAGARGRYLRRKRSHHYLPSKAVFKKLMKARTLEEFHLAYAPLRKDGAPQWHLVQRAGVNLTHLWKTDTIEFRCFTMSPDPHKLLCAFRWPKLFLKAALFTGKTPECILESHDLIFQEFFPYSYNMDRIYQMTNVRYNSRKVAAENYEKLIAKGVIRREDLR